MCFEISGHASTLGGRALFTISTSDDDTSDAAVFERPPDRNSGFTIDVVVTLSPLDPTSTPFAASFPGDSCASLACPSLRLQAFAPSPQPPT
jgi:hypothetical protein